MEYLAAGVVASVRRLLLSLAAAGALLVPAASLSARPTDIMPASDLAPGMKGYGFSDLGDGKGVQRFEIEVVGLLKSYAPKQDLILARVLGTMLDKTGIIAGMSGSPIYVDGRLVGALAYGWPFSREPICGITPIQSMLDIRKAPATPPVPIGGAATQAAAFVSAFRDRSFVSPFAALLAPFKPDKASSGPTPLPLPVSLSGSVEPGRLFGQLAEAAGWMVAPAGASSKPQTAAAPPPPETPRLEPGSAVAAVLLSGDMILSATGTVTWVDGNSVLAFGHPFLSMGPVDMPMASADVLTVLPSLYRSFKFATTGAVLGSVSQDRSTGILGNFGNAPKMVPI